MTKLFRVGDRLKHKEPRFTREYDETLYPVIKAIYTDYYIIAWCYYESDIKFVENKWGFRNTHDELTLDLDFYFTYDLNKVLNES